MVEQSTKKSLFNQITQVMVPTLTIGAQAATAIKFPQWGLIINMLAQPFWLYSSWKAYRNAGQIGLLITTVTVTIILAMGIINYWVSPLVF